MKDTKIILTLPSDFWSWPEEERLSYVNDELRSAEIQLPNYEDFVKKIRLNELREDKIVYDVIYLER